MQTTPVILTRDCAAVSLCMLMAGWQSVLQTGTPIFLDIRPWGSCCSIIAHNYVRRGKMMSQGVARILLCGILSDTINLMSPTTTDADRIALVMLTAVARVDDLDLVVRYYILCNERATESNETSY